LRITYIVIKQFARWVREVTPPTIDIRIFGLNPDDLETVKAFLEENCRDLTYNECKEWFLKTYLQGIRARTEEEIENMALSQTLQMMSYYLETTSVSEAFKRIYMKYGA